MYFNTMFSWNTSGVMDAKNSNADVRTIATHEYGHAATLLHPEDCGGGNTSSVMHPNWTTKHTPTSRDRDAIRALYGS